MKRAIIAVLLPALVGLTAACNPANPIGPTTDTNSYTSVVPSCYPNCPTSGKSG